MTMFKRLKDRAYRWLIKEGSPPTTFLCDFDRLSFEIRPCDVLLVEGHSRLSEVIKTITQSNWSHAALYIGRLSEIDDADIRCRIRRHYDADAHEQLIVEAYMGKGTIISPLARYRDHHLRICRPRSLVPADARQIIHYVTAHLGSDYDVRQLLDLARFLLPYGILPRRWRSSLFTYRAGRPTRTICSSLLAAAFASIRYPVRPVIQQHEEGDMRLYRRNERLFTPSDFDYSPYFDIIKYPYLGLDEAALYRHLPWNETSLVCNAEGDCFISPAWLPDPAAYEPQPCAESDTPDAESPAADEPGRQSAPARRVAS